MSRLGVKKTYKLFLEGEFSRSESGRYYPLVDGEGNLLANVSLASRKDFRNAVSAASSAQPNWQQSSPHLRGKVLYRIAELLESRVPQFIEELIAEGVCASVAENEVQQAVDLLVYYAGWSDKYQAIFSSVNPVSSPYLNYSSPEPIGVVSVVVPEESSLLGLVSVLAPVIVGGNSCVLLASHTMPMSAISLAEVIATSDLPAGVVNVLTGQREELLEHMAGHLGVQGLLMCSSDLDERRLVRQLGAENLKAVILREDQALAQGPYPILDFQEVKSGWLPVGL